MKSDMQMTRRSALLLAASTSVVVGACSQKQYLPDPKPEGPFKHGVASGDPDSTSLMVWTALSAQDDGPVRVEVSSTPDFAQRVIEHEALPSGEPVDGAVPFKVLVDGLDAGTAIWYRFRYREHLSPIGKAKTLPVGAVDKFQIAAFSCSNYPAGFFNAYAHAARRDDVDLILHLGDYIYEYGADGYASEDAQRLSRVSDPLHEIVTYDDYARRHALYCADRDLMALKASAPLVMIWDDHETANNSYRDGAQNHNEGEGVWIERRDAALRAWQAWTPSRPHDPMHERWNSLDIGDLASLITLETRLSARSAEVTFDEFPLDVDAHDPDDPQARQQVADWLEATAGEPSRTMLGAEQLEFVSESLAASVQKNQPWRIFANQVIMGKVPAPNYPKLVPFWVRWAIQSSDPLAWSFIKRFAFGTPFNLDAWDGYPAERERLYAAARQVGADFITLTGDTHNGWVLDLHDDKGQRVGTEFGVTSVSSPSRFERLDLPGVDFGVYTEGHAEEVVRHDAYNRGYVHLTLTPDEARAELMVISTCKSRDYEAYTDSTWRIRPAQDGEAQPVERVG